MTGASIDNKFVVGAVVLAVAVMFLLPTMISVFIENHDGQAIENLDDVLAGYTAFTGQSATSENVWALTGIYTPYGVDANGQASSNYGYTEDHWLYGARIPGYSPAQFTGAAAYTVSYDKGFYYYSVNSGTTQDGHANGDLYTSVAMTTSQKSNIFFSQNNKQINGDNWYYEYTGYRYAFQALSDYYYKNSDGDIVKTTASSTSLSMIWYDFYGNQGLSGQLTLSGSDSGVAFLTAADIVTAYDAGNNLAKFKMVFNGNDMNVYIKILPSYTSQGYSIQECFNNGYWEIMITSVCTDTTMYTSSDYSFSIYNIWDTFVDLFSFDMSSYALSPTMGLVASLTISVCLYAILISLGLSCYPILILAGILAAIQTFVCTGLTF